MKKSPLIVILGSTAMGKTKVASNVASLIDGEIISADSRQIFRGMDIGTGKDYQDYMVDNHRVPCHLIDIHNPGETYNVHRFQKDFQTAYEDIIKRRKQPILCGGTGLYIQAVLENFRLTAIPSDPDLRELLDNLTKNELVPQVENLSFPEGFQPDLSSKKRLIRAIEIGEFLKSNSFNQGIPNNLECTIFGISAGREIRRHRITERLKYRLEIGMIEEVHQLLDDGIAPERLRFYGLEYRYIMDHIEGMLNEKELFEKLNIAIHQFSKRQMTWFRKMERDGYKINWLDAALPLENKVRTIVDKYCG